MDSDQSQYRQHGLDGAGHSLFGCVLALQIAVFLALGIRIVSRKMSKGGIGADDWVIIVSVSFDVVMTAVTATDVFFGYGNPANSLSPSDRITVLQLFWIFQIVYKIVIGCCKLSFCLFFSRIFPRGNKVFRYCNLAVMGLVASYSIASVITTIVQCNPVPRVWDHSINGTCINLTAFWLSGAVYSISTDFCIIVLPVVICWNLKIGKHDRFFLCAIFSAGLFVIGMSIARVTTLDVSSKTTDPSSGTISSTTWTTIEANTMIIVACLPSFKPPAKWIYHRCRSSIGSRCMASDSLHRSTAHEGWRASTMDLRDIAVTTDVNVEFEEKSRDSSMLNSSEREAMVRAHEVA